MISCGSAWLLTGQEVAIAPTAMFGAVDWETMARLRRLHAAATQLALTSPEVIGNSHAARGLEELLVEAFVDSLTQGQLRDEVSKPAQAHCNR